MTAIVLRGDARRLPLPDGSVDLIVTSPPYYALRAYMDGGEAYDGQIGSEPTPTAYIDNLIACTREWIRVLKPTGSLWINLGDTLSAQPFVPTKCWAGLPWRYALRCIDDLGLILRAEVVWSKPNGLPESVTDRVRRSHEQWFWLSTWAPEGPPPELIRAVLEQVAAGVLTVDEAERLLTLDMTSHEVWFHATKQPRYYSAIDHIREDYAQSSVDRAHLVHNGSPKDARLVASGDKRVPFKPSAYAGSPLGKLPGSVWEIATEPLTVPAHLGVDHFAAFPTEFPRRIILGWSPSGICTACGEGRRPVADKVRRNTRPLLTDSAHFVAHQGDERRAYSRGETDVTITGEACACPDTTAPTRPALILDPCGGTGTVALVAHAYGRVGITVDMSADYSRLAAWRTSDRGELAKAMRVDKPPKQLDGQADLFDLGGIT
jgi:ubiquinone/menaquinone biosynthesis C-methylase UbiE